MKPNYLSVFMFYCHNKLNGVVNHNFVMKIRCAMIFRRLNLMFSFMVSGINTGQFQANVAEIIITFCTQSLFALRKACSPSKIFFSWSELTIVKMNMEYLMPQVLWHEWVVSGMEYCYNITGLNIIQSLKLHRNKCKTIL